MIRRRKAILVTDADHGVGRATTLWLGEQGYRVLAGGRDLEAMQDLPRETSQGGLVDIVPLDTSDDDSCAAALDHLRAVFHEVDGLVCSGGRARFGPVEETEEASVRALFEDNFFGPWRMLRVFAPVLRDQRDGTMVCVSNAAGRVGLPMSGPYSATHHALEGLCDALRLELGVFGVHVVLVEPGLLRDRVTADPGAVPDAGALLNVGPDSPYRPAADLLVAAYHQLLPRAATPHDVAQVIDRALSHARPKPRYTVSRGAAALIWARKLLPDRLLDRRFARAMGVSRRDPS